MDKQQTLQGLIVKMLLWNYVSKSDIIPSVLFLNVDEGFFPKTAHTNTLNYYSQSLLSMFLKS